MSAFQTISYADTGTKASINLDPSIAPFNASVAVKLASTGTYGLQYSLDPMTVSDVSAVWFDSANLGTGTAASGVTNFMFPVSRIRLVIAANGSDITLQVLQGFTTN